MAIAFRSAGTFAESAATSITVGANASQALTDQNFLLVNVKPFNIVVNTPSGWEKLFEITNGSTASGVDVGSVKTIVYMRVGITGSAFVSTTTTPAVLAGVMWGYSRAGSEAWVVNGTTGIDNTHGANYSATAASNFLAVANNFIVAATGINSDTGTLSAQSITATGLTLGATNTRSSVGVTAGDDGRLMVQDCSVTSGTQTAAAVFSYTNASSGSGATVFIKLAVVTAPTISADELNLIGADAGYAVTTTGMSSYDQFKITRVSQTGAFTEESVRGGDFQNVTTSGIVTNDYEFHWSDPQDGIAETFKYRLYVYVNNNLNDIIDSTTIDPFTDRAAEVGYDVVRSPTTWIKHVATPALNQAVTIQEFGDWTRSGRFLGVHNVLGRRNPVVITDATEGMKGSFQILTHQTTDWPGGNATANQGRSIDLLFDQGSVYFFSNIFPYLTGIPDFYFVVESYTMKRVNRVVDLGVATASATAILPFTIWEVGFVEVDRPSTVVAVFSDTWAEIGVNYATWNDVLGNNDDWLDVLIDG